MKQLNLLFSLVLLLCLPHLAYSQTDTIADKAIALHKELGELRKSITPQEYVGRDLDKDLQSVEIVANAKDYLVDIEKNFKSLIAEDRQPYRNLGYMLAGMKETVTQFESAAKKFCSMESIDQDLDHVQKMAQRAVENQAPAYFKEGNDIHNRTALVRNKIRLLETLDPKGDSLSKAKQKLEESNKKVAEIQKSLVGEILQQNSLPDDNYKQSDRNELVEKLQSHWTSKGNGRKAMKVGIVGGNWNRTVAWEIQNRTATKVDRSRIQGWVLVEQDAKTVVRHSINLFKDHLNGDRITAVFVSDPKEQPDLSNVLLKERAK